MEIVNSVLPRKVEKTPPCTAESHTVAGFKIEQRPLLLFTPGVASQSAVRSDHPVAGNDDADRVPAIGRSHRPCRCRSVDPRREFSVSGGCAVGNRRQCLPDRALELGTRRCQGKVEVGAGAGEVLPQLFICRGEQCEVVVEDRRDSDFRLQSFQDCVEVIELESGQMCTVRGEQDRTQRRVDDRIANSVRGGACHLCRHCLLRF